MLKDGVLGDGRSGKDYSRAPLIKAAGEELWRMMAAILYFAFFSSQRLEQGRRKELGWMVEESVGCLDDLNICFELVRTMDFIRPEAVPNTRLGGSERFKMKCIIVSGQMNEFIQNSEFILVGGRVKRMEGGRRKGGGVLCFINVLFLSSMLVILLLCRMQMMESSGFGLKLPSTSRCSCNAA